MADPATIMMALKAAAGVLTDKRTRKIVGGILIAILSPIIFIIAVIMGILGGGASHNTSAVQYAYHGGELPDDAPPEYREYMDRMQNCFSGLDTAINEINAMCESDSLNSARVKAVFYSLHFGTDNLNFNSSYYRDFVDNFVQYEEREREIEVENEDGTKITVTETYTAAIPISNLSEVFSSLSGFLGRGITPNELSNTTEIYNAMLYGDNIITDTYGENGYWSNGLSDTEIQYLGSGSETQVVYYNQTDARWGTELYGRTGTIASSACGPTALAMVVSTMTNRVINPSEMAKWANDNGYRAEGNGSYHSLIPEGGRHFGLNVEGAYYTEGQKIVDALSQGKLVIAIMTTGHFTKGGHFIVLRGVTPNGEILVADPASEKRSEQTWPLSIILNEAHKGAGAGGPFWIFSQP